MMKSNFRNTHTLFICAILVNIFLAGSCVFLWQKINDTASKIDIREQEVAEQEAQKINSYQLVTFVKKEIDPTNKQIEKYFINRDNFIDFIEHIEALADKSHVSVEIKSTELAAALQLNLNFEVSFNDSMYFVALIETLPINLRIDSVRTEQVSAGLWRGWATVKLPGSGEGNN